MTDQPPLQLDIFAHSRDTMLRNDLIEALSRRDAGTARAAWNALDAEFGDDATLVPATLLVDAVAHPQATPFADPAAARAAHGFVADELAPAACAVLGAAAARPWIAAEWAALAARAQRLPFEAAQADTHAAALWLEAGAWRQAAQAVEGIESWRRIPQPLAWMARARWQGEGIDAAWPLLVELAWLAPARFAALARGGADKSLQKLLRAFESDYEGFEGDASWAWFPAWALVEQPLLAAPMASARALRDTRPERAWSTVAALLRIERRADNQERKAQRERLQGLDEALFKAYMRTRA